MLEGTAKELFEMGYNTELSVSMGNDIDSLAKKWGVGTVEDMKEALMRRVQKDYNKGEV